MGAWAKSAAAILLPFAAAGALLYPFIGTWAWVIGLVAAGLILHRIN